MCGYENKKNRLSSSQIHVRVRMTKKKAMKFPPAEMALFGCFGLIHRGGQLGPSKFLVLHRADECTVGGWGTHQPLGSKHDKQLLGIPMIPSVAFLDEGEVYLRGGPILLQEWPEGDSQQKQGMSGKYQRLLTLATSSVRLGATNRCDRASARVSS